MSDDILYLIEPDFEVPGRSDGPFVCPFCNQIEGLLASFPQLALDIEVIRVPFPARAQRSSRWSARKTRHSRC